MNTEANPNVRRCIIGTLICHLALAAYLVLALTIVPQDPLIPLLLAVVVYTIFFVIGWRIAANRGASRLIENVPVMVASYRNFLLAQLGALIVMLIISNTILGGLPLLDALSLLLFGVFILLFSAMMSSTAAYILRNQSR